MLEKIEFFRGEYRWLSNFYPVEIRYDGQTYRTVEHAYQAAKCARVDDRRWFLTRSSAGDAKSVGRTIDRRSDWEAVKIEIMKSLLIKKFMNFELDKLLRDTGTCELVEGNYWGDEFWGVDLRTGRGENHLGKMLMAIREILLTPGALIGICDFKYP